MNYYKKLRVKNLSKLYFKSSIMEPKSPCQSAPLKPKVMRDNEEGEDWENYSLNDTQQTIPETKSPSILMRKLNEANADKVLLPMEINEENVQVGSIRKIKTMKTRLKPKRFNSSFLEPK